MHNDNITTQYIGVIMSGVKRVIPPTDLQKLETKKTCGIAFSILENPG